MRKRGGYGGQFWQRFAAYAPPVRQRLSSQPQDFWIHAVSVGEVVVARKLVDALNRGCDNLALTLSTTTSTGYAVAVKSCPNNLTVIYNPLDIPGVVGRAFRAISPRHIVLVEAEVWPNLLACAARHQVPVSLVNARMSDRSARRYHRFRTLVQPVFSQLDHVFVQEPSDVERWEALGVPADRITRVGSLKFDQENRPQPSDIERFRRLLDRLWPTPPRRLILAASTHPGEEALTARAVRSLRAEFPELRLAVVPRHAERGQEIADELVKEGFHVILKSELQGDGQPAEDAAVFLIDSTGELDAWTALADVVIIGKSLLAEGGQNPVEAVAAGKPVVVGPHMQNFRALTDRLLERDAVFQVSSAEALEPDLRNLLADPSAAARMAGRAKAVLDEHFGANARTARFLLGRGGD